VLDTNVVVMATPFHITWLPLTKLVPVAVRARGVVMPFGEVFGVIEDSVGGGAPPPVPLPVMVRMSAPDVVVSGFIARMVITPALAICAAETVAVSFVAELTVVGSEAPSQRTVVPDTKFVPVAVRVNAAPPAATVVGSMEDKVGVTTPLNPPHPPRNKERTKRKRKP